MTDRARTVALIVALVFSGAALTVAFISSSAPWQELAESRAVEVAYQKDQNQNLMVRYQRFAEGAIRAEQARAMEAVSGLQALVDAIESGSDVTNALADAKSKLREWTQ